MRIRAKYLLPAVVITSLGISQVLSALTRAEMTTQARLLLDDPSTTTAKQAWSDTDLQLRFWQGEIDTTRKARCLLSTTFYTLTTNLSTYTLTSDVMFIERVGYRITGTTSTYQRLTRYTMLGLDSELSQWENTSSGLPNKYYTFGHIIGIIPKPSAAYSGNDRLRIDFVIKPSSMTSDTAEPFNDVDMMTPYHMLPVWYCVALCHMDDGDFGKADYCWKRYYDLLSVLINEFNEKPDWSPVFRIWNYNESDR